MSNNPPEPLRAEVSRLRQILWEIFKMTGGEGPDEAPAVGVTDPDVPEAALDSVKAFLAEYLSYTTPRGSDINPHAGPDDRCVRCGQVITMLNRMWLHLYNENLSPTGGGHTPRPSERTVAPREDPVANPERVLDRDAVRQLYDEIQVTVEEAQVTATERAADRVRHSDSGTYYIEPNTWVTRRIEEP
jgi:hypothetical protein